MDTDSITDAIDHLTQGRAHMIDSVFQLDRREHREAQDAMLLLVERIDELIDDVIELADRFAKPSKRPTRCRKCARAAQKTPVQVGAH